MCLCEAKIKKTKNKNKKEEQSIPCFKPCKRQRESSANGIMKKITEMNLKLGENRNYGFGTVVKRQGIFDDVIEYHGTVCEITAKECWSGIKKTFLFAGTAEQIKFGKLINSLRKSKVWGFYEEKEGEKWSCLVDTNHGQFELVALDVAGRHMFHLGDIMPPEGIETIKDWISTF